MDKLCSDFAILPSDYAIAAILRNFFRQKRVFAIIPLMLEALFRFRRSRRREGPRRHRARRESLRRHPDAAAQPDPPTSGHRP